MSRWSWEANWWQLLGYWSNASVQYTDMVCSTVSGRLLHILHWSVVHFLMMCIHLMASLILECNTCIFVPIKLNSKHGAKINYCIHFRYSTVSARMSAFITVCASDMWFVMNWHTEGLFTPLGLKIVRNQCYLVGQCKEGLLSKWHWISN